VTFEIAIGVSFVVAVVAAEVTNFLLPQPLFQGCL
jgi:hypothetical protein